MRILQIADVPEWAIGHLAAIPRRHLPHLHFKILYVHPKHVAEHLDEVQAELSWADVIDLQYWNTAAQLLDMLPEIRSKRLILTHHNQKDLLAREWTEIAWHVVHTKKAEAVLKGAGYANVSIVPYGFDLSYFKYIDHPVAHDIPIIGYVGRIVPWKGLKEIARVCFELGYQLAIMGKMDKPLYWDEIPLEHRANIDMSFMQVPDIERYEFYKSIDVYVGNSGDNHEEGTMPLQEVMACGVPVVTTPSGVVADMCVDHENALVVPFGDYEALKANIRQLAESSELREKLRRAGWQTIKGHTEERMAWNFERIYHQVLDSEPLVSVIVPTYNALDNLKQIVECLAGDDYPHLEIVIADDGSIDGTYTWVHDFRAQHEDVIIKFVSTKPCMHCIECGKPYGLAKARNLAAIEAGGELLVFCDSRLLPESGAITVFVAAFKNQPKDKMWWYGDKGTGKKTFVENFSAIRRDYFINAGMCNERMDHYGGMSQELRSRFEAQGFTEQYLEEAKAIQISGSHLTDKRRQDIIHSKKILWKMGL